MNELEKSQKFWGVVMFIGIAICLIWLLIGVFVLLLTSVSTPTPVDAFGEEFPSIIAEGKIIKFTYTDDNSNEDFIIRSDKKVYTPLWAWNGFDVYFMVENKSGKDQLTFSQLFFSKNFTIEKVSILDPDATITIKEPIYQEVCIPPDPCYNKKVGEQDKIVDGKWNAVNQYPFSEKDYQGLISEYNVPVKEKIGQAKQKFLAPIVKDNIVYYRVRLKAHEHFVETEFDIEVIGDSGGYGLLDPTILTENFNAYNDGDLNGQGSWTGNINFDVQSSVIKEGAKAIKGIDNTGSFQSVIKTGAGITDGKITIYIRKNSNNVDVAYFNLTEATNLKIQTCLRPDGNISYHNGGAWIPITTYDSGQWYSIEIEWRDVDKKARYKVDGGSWTIWDTPASSWTTNLDGVQLATYQSTATSYFDYIAEDPLEAPPPPTYPFVDNFENYDLGNIVGQGGWQHLDSSGTFNVVDTIVNNGTKSVQAVSGRVDKLGEYVPVGEWFFYLYKGDEAFNSFEILLQGDSDVWDIGCGMVSLDNYPVEQEDEVCIYNMAGGFDQICFGETIRDEWFKLTIQWDFPSMLYRAKVNNGEYSGWAIIYDECSEVGFRGVRFRTNSNATFIDDIGEEITPLVWGIDPESGTEITDLDTLLTIGFEGLESLDSLYITFKHLQTGIFTDAKKYAISEIGVSGELEINLENFNIEKNSDWYLHAVATYEGFQYEGGYFLVDYGWNWTGDLTEQTYYLDINIEGFEEIFVVSDFETWYSENAKFDEPTAMFSAMASVFDPIFSVIGEFGNRIIDYFNVNESYAQGYEIGRTISYFRYFVDQIGLLLGGFPILLWLFIIILLLTGVFIFRLILKFIPFLGGS